MKTKKINLGRVGLVPKGAYSPDVTYGRMHVVTYKNTTYWSKQEGNTGHEPLGEDDWWGILVDGQAAYAGAFNANEAAVRANTAAKEAERTNSAVRGAEMEREFAEGERNQAEEQRKAQAQSNAEAEQSRADAERSRVEAETQRVEAEERRASEETLRAAAEETRKSDEADRIAGETSREQQEESRESAEQTRDADEAQRKIDETKRADEEAKRADAEDARKEAETGRVSAESDRAAAEVARAKAETARADAENKRAAAETKRETDFSAKVEEVDTAVKNAKTATAEAEKVDATITDANVFEVTGRDGVKKSLGLVGQAEAATIKTELAGKLDKVSVVQELGKAEDKVVSQKVVSEKINDLSDTKLNKESSTEYNSDTFSKDSQYVSASDGSLLSADTLKATDFIPCVDATRISVCANFINPYVAAIAFYDVEKKFISAISNTGSVNNDNEVKEIGTSSIPSNTAYIRATSVNNPYLTKTQPYIHIYYGIKETIDKKADKKAVDVELGKKFDKGSVVQEFGDSEELVMSQKCTSVIYEKLKNAQYLVDSDDMESFYITDENGYIIAKVDKNGLHAINIPDTRITLSEKVSNGIPLYHNGEYVYGGCSSLYRKKVVGVGDSLSQNGLYEKDFCEISGAEYAGVYSIGGRNSIPSITKKSSQDSIKKLLDDNIDVDILLFENINDGWFTGVFQGPQFPGAITDKPFFAEQYVPSSKVYSSYAAAKKAFESEFDTITGSIENKTKGTCFAIRYTSSSYSIKVNSSSKSSGSIILKIGDAKYTTTISASMSAQEIASAIGITNYVFFDKRIDGDTVILTFNGDGELPNVSIDTNDTGAELSIVNQASAESYVNAYFMGYTSSEFASISNWQIGYLTLYSAYKGIIEKLQSERPNLRIVFISPSVWSQSWNESTSTYDASLMNEDGTFNYSKIMEQDYVKRNLKLIEIKKEVSELYNIEHIDIHHICGVSPFNMKGFYNENDVHPKRELYTLWAKIIYNNLK